MGASRLAACLLAASLSACTTRPPSPAAAAAPPPASLPAATAADPFAALFATLETATPAAPVLRIGDDALIAVTVRRGGALARLGHDHVVAARRIDGRVDPVAGLAVLRFRLAEMTVDETALRQEAGLTTQPSADAIAGTRTNMLARVLDAETFPVVEVRARRAGDGGALQADITLHGVTRRYTVPAAIEPAEQGRQGLVARGTLVLKQTDFGITPFSVMGGALAVQDALEIRFVLPARPAARDAVR